MSMQARKKGLVIILVSLFLIPFSLAAAYDQNMLGSNGEVPRDISMHELRFVVNGSRNISVDANENGIIDLAEYVVNGGGGNVGPGTINTIPIFDTTTSIADSRIIDDGSIVQIRSPLYVTGNVGIGTPLPQEQLDVSATIRTNSLQYTPQFGGPSINAYYDSGQWHYLANGYASLIQQDGTNGGLMLSTVSSGTAGNAITFGLGIYLDDTGNVGIGLGDPSEKLSVEGNILASGTICDGNANCLDTVGRGLWTLSGNDIYYDTGNVGIGTTTPLRARLETRGMVGNTLAVFGQDVRGVSLIANWPVIGFNTYFNEGYLSIADGYAGAIGVDPGNGRMAFYTSDNPGGADLPLTVDERLTIVNNGDIGIGDNSPSAKLDIASGTGPTLALGRVPGQPSIVGRDDAAGDWMIIEGSSSSGRVALNWYGSGNVRLARGGGNVGIGPGAPTATLEVFGGPIKATGGLIIETRASDPPSPQTGQIWLIT